MQNFKYSYSDTLKENTGLAVHNSGYEKCAAGYQWGPGVRDHYLIHYVSSGQGFFAYDGKEYALCEGDLFLIAPEQVVHYRAAEDNPWEYYWVGFNGTDAHRLVSMAGFGTNEPIMHTDDPAIREALLNIYYARGNTPAADAEMTGHLQLFLAKLMRHNGTTTATAGSQTYLAQALRYIQHNYADDIGVSDIAAFVGVSRSQLYRAFQAEFQLSPHAYLRKYRIGEACALLHNRSLTVAQVAGSVGFNDPLYFSRVFHQQKHCTPTEYQKRKRNEPEK